MSDEAVSAATSYCSRGYAWRDIKGCVLKSQRIAAREGFHFRDLIGTRFEDHEILEWAPLVAGERVEL